jgi:hypothetical protein
MITQKTFNVAAALLLACATIGYTGCSTSKDTAGNTTTTLSASGDAAVAAAVQIANTAAQAAIQTYITSAPQTKARLARSANEPAIAAAKRATETEIRNALPNLSPFKIHNIVAHAFAERLHSTP